MRTDCLYPEIEPFAAGELAVDGRHVLYYEQCGRLDGEPILFVHGGPGAGCSPIDRRFFDPSRFHAVLFDQRGAGRSRPLGELKDNTPRHLIADIERLRTALKIHSWHVFGGSWGAALGLWYAQEYPSRCRSLVLRGTCFLRSAELRWWLRDLAWIQPEAHRRFVEHLPEDERGDLLEAYWRRMSGADRVAAEAAAVAWRRYESASCTIVPDPDFTEPVEPPATALALARLEAHYFRNLRPDPETLLLDRVDRIRGVPAFAVHGRYDLVCPVRNLYDLADRWPELDRVVVADAGHLSLEPGIARELVAATDRIAATGSPCRVAAR